MLCGLPTASTASVPKDFCISTERFIGRQGGIIEPNGRPYDPVDGIVRAFVAAVEAKDVYTAGHSYRVSRYSLAIGRELGYTEDQLSTLEYGAVMHDIGKIGVPDAILNYPGQLSDEQFELIKPHPRLGHGMVEHIGPLGASLDIILYHHERLDGSGYPFGIGGDQIREAVRIVAVADVFDAMTSQRAYREALQPSFAMDCLEIEAQIGRLDGKIVEVLADIINREETNSFGSFLSVA